MYNTKREIAISRYLLIVLLFGVIHIAQKGIAYEHQVIESYNSKLFGVVQKRYKNNEIDACHAKWSAESILRRQANSHETELRSQVATFVTERSKECTK